MKVTQHHTDVLYWLENKFQCGKVVKNRNAYDWIIRNQADIHRIIIDITPYLQVKAKQSALVLIILAARPSNKDEFLDLVRTTDALSKLNVRSTNRRINTAAMVEEAFSRND